MYVPSIYICSVDGRKFVILDMVGGSSILKERNGQTENIRVSLMN